LDAQETDWELSDDGRTAAREEKDPAMMNTQRKPNGSAAFFTALLLLSVMAGAALAATPTTTDYRNATTPMITGTASLVNEHQLLIQTEQGEEVLLSLDTRTMVPADLAPGMMMRVQFKYLEDGSRLAERVTPIRNGEKTTRELAYSNERQDSDNYGDAQLAATGETRVTETHAYDTHVSPAGTVTNQPLGTPLKPIPSTQAYRLATEPALAGRVGMVNDHHIVVDTDQGHSVPVEMDSRTLIPTDLQTGMGVRVEYKTLEDGTKLATRVTPLKGVEVPEREMATSSTSASQDEAVPASYNGGTTTDNDQMAQNQTDNESQEHDANANTNANPDDDRRLPKTASNEPLIAALGLLSLAAAGALAMRRRVG
jgi:LPXTG-motif cell wall-anchored protein